MLKIMAASDNKNSVLFAIIFFLLLLIITTAILTKYPTQNPQLSIEKVVITGNNCNICVKYAILNKSSSAKRFPLIKIKLIDQNDDVIKSYITNGLKSQIGSQERVYIQTKFTDVTKKVVRVDITLGNILDVLIN